MTETIYFNTGRCYTKAGQRITATRHDDGIITFMDHDRMIPGELVWGRAFTASSVLAAYDACDYKNTSRAMADGMQRGGCNTAAEKPAPAPTPAPAPIPTQPAAEGPASPLLVTAPRRGDRVQVRTAFGHGPVMMVTVLGLGEKNGKPLVDYETDNGERRWAYLDQLVKPRKLFVVVENAGYERETDIESFSTLRAAIGFVQTQYDEEERETLHVDICTEINGEREYVY